jgi:hypothetical protein
MSAMGGCFAAGTAWAREGWAKPTSLRNSEMRMHTRRPGSEARGAGTWPRVHGHVRLLWRSRGGRGGRDDPPHSQWLEFLWCSNASACLVQRTCSCGPGASICFIHGSQKIIEAGAICGRVDPAQAHCQNVQIMRRHQPDRHRALSTSCISLAVLNFFHRPRTLHSVDSCYRSGSVASGRY